jgi:hypothetical protein
MTRLSRPQAAVLQGAHHHDPHHCTVIIIGSSPPPPVKIRSSIVSWLLHPHRLVEDQALFGEVWKKAPAKEGGEEGEEEAPSVSSLPEPLLEPQVLSSSSWWW